MAKLASWLSMGCVALPSVALAAPPAFQAYPAQVYTGPTVRPDFKGRARPHAPFRSRLLAGFRGKPDFAGSWRVITFGCGTGCAMVMLGNLATGDVLDTDLGGEDHPELGLQHRANSRLLVATWATEPMGDQCRQQAFELEAGKLKPVGGARPAPCAP